MKLIWSSISWDDYLYCQNTDKKILKRINALIKSGMRTHYEGIGKPEALRIHKVTGPDVLLPNIGWFINMKMKV